MAERGANDNTRWQEYRRGGRRSIWAGEGSLPTGGLSRKARLAALQYALASVTSGVRQVPLGTHAHTHNRRDDELSPKIANARPKTILVVCVFWVEKRKTVQSLQFKIAPSNDLTPEQIKGAVYTSILLYRACRWWRDSISGMPNGWVEYIMGMLESWCADLSKSGRCRHQTYTGRYH